MMQHKVVQKRLIKLGIVAGIVLALILVTHIFLASQLSNADEELNKINGQISDLKTKLSEVDSKEKLRVRAYDFYLLYEATPSANPANFTREYARGVIADLREQYTFSNLQMSNSGFKEIKVPESTEKSIILKSTTSVKFNSNFEMPIYEFLEKLDNLPGKIDITSVTIKKEVDPTEATIAEIGSGVDRGLIVADISFDWYGVIDPNAKLPSSEVVPVESGAAEIQNIFDRVQDNDQQKQKQEIEKRIKDAEIKPEPAQPLPEAPKKVPGAIQKLPAPTLSVPAAPVPTEVPAITAPPIAKKEAPVAVAPVKKIVPTVPVKSGPVKLQDITPSKDTAPVQLEVPVGAQE